MSHDILSMEGRRGEVGAAGEQAKEEEDVECVDTKIWLWDGEDYD